MKSWKQKLLLWLLKRMGWVHICVVDNVNDESVDCW